MNIEIDKEAEPTITLSEYTAEIDRVHNEKLTIQKVLTNEHYKIIKYMKDKNPPFSWQEITDFMNDKFFPDNPITIDSVKARWLRKIKKV